MDEIHIKMFNDIISESIEQKRDKIISFLKERLKYYLSWDPEYMDIETVADFLKLNLCDDNYYFSFWDAIELDIINFINAECIKPVVEKYKIDENDYYYQELRDTVLFYKYTNEFIEKLKNIEISTLLDNPIIVRTADQGGNNDR